MEAQVGTFKKHLDTVTTEYRNAIVGERFDDVDRDLTERGWKARYEGPPLKESIIEKADELFEELRTAVKKRDMVGALTSIKRISKYSENIGV